MELEPIADRYDVIIAGARCAGAATARLLAQGGARVLVVDPARPGSDTLSTHALMRGAVVQLHRWGLLEAVAAAGTPAIRRTTFHYGDRDPIAVDIQERHGTHALYAPRRTVLDTILVDAAQAEGVHVAFGWSLRGLVRDSSGRVTGARITGTGGAERCVGSAIVIGADGARSQVARLVEAELLHEGQHTTASIYGYVDALDSDGYHWYYDLGMAAGTIPTNHGKACVFCSIDPGVLRSGGRPLLRETFLNTVEKMAPQLLPRLRVEEPRLRAFAGLHGFVRRSAGPGWALVGDAGYFKDPLTAHGITDAFRDAEFLAEAVLSGRDERIQEYPVLRDTMVRSFMEVTDEIASMNWTLDEVQALHRTANREMNRIVEAQLEAFDRSVRGTGTTTPTVLSVRLSA